MDGITDQERMASFAARQQSAFDPLTASALDVAQHYARGESIPDRVIGQMRTANPEAWGAAIDPGMRVKLLAQNAPAPTVTADATPRAKQPPDIKQSVVRFGVLLDACKELRKGFVSDIEAMDEAVALKLQKQSADLATATSRIALALMQLEA